MAQQGDDEPGDGGVLADDGLATSVRSRISALAGGSAASLVGGASGGGHEGHGWSRSAYLRFEGVQLVGERHEGRVVLRFGTVQELRRRRLRDAPCVRRRRRPRAVPSRRGAGRESRCHAGKGRVAQRVAARRRERAAR